ncbi:hypothetical protein CHUAL_010151 [Chamberlinius hualienensis]
MDVQHIEVTPDNPEDGSVSPSSCRSYPVEKVAGKYFSVCQLKESPQTPGKETRISV